MAHAGCGGAFSFARANVVQWMLRAPPGLHAATTGPSADIASSAREPAASHTLRVTYSAGRVSALHRPRHRNASCTAHRQEGMPRRWSRPSHQMHAAVGSVTRDPATAFRSGPAARGSFKPAGVECAFGRWVLSRPIRRFFPHGPWLRPRMLNCGHWTSPGRKCWLNPARTQVPANRRACGGSGPSDGSPPA